MIDDEETRSGTMPRDKKSQRIGTSGGRAARTFHCKFGSQRVGSGKRAGAVDYLAREGHYTDRDDLEHVSPAGERESFLEAAEAIEAVARIKTGPQAERVMVSLIVELPMDTTKAQRAAMMDGIAGIWRDKGHLVVGAVHGNDQVQPHAHLAITARPVAREGGEWVVNRTPGNIPCTGIQALRDARGAVAGAINAVMETQGSEAPRFHPGRLKDTGIARPAKVRLPMAEYHRQIRGDGSFTRKLNEQIEAVVEAEAVGKRHVSTNPELADQMGPIVNSTSIENTRIAWGRKQREDREARKAREKAAAAKDKAAATRAANKRIKALETENTQLRRSKAVVDVAAKPVPSMSVKQRDMLEDAHRRLGMDLPELTTHEGQRLAWAVFKAEQAARKGQEEDKDRENRALKAEISALKARLSEQAPKVPESAHARPGASDGIPGAFVARGSESLRPAMETSGSPARAKGTVVRLIDPGRDPQGATVQLRTIQGLPDGKLLASLAVTLEAGLQGRSMDLHRGIQALAGEVKRRGLTLDPETKALTTKYRERTSRGLER